MRDTPTIHRRLFSIISRIPAALCALRPMHMAQAFLVLFLFLLSTPASAQSSSGATWRLFEVHDGMPTTDIWAVLAQEDAIWMATLDGISRYNGVWTNFRYHEPIATNESGTPTTIEAVPFLDNEASQLPKLKGTVVALEPGAHNGSIWAGAQSGEVLYWDGHTWELVAELPAALYRLSEHDGHVYVATNKGLYEFDPVSQVATLVPTFAGTPITALYSGTDLWVGTGDGAFLWNEDGSWTHLRLPSHYGTTAVTSIAVDDDGYLWVGTSQGVAWLHMPTSIWATEMMPVANELGQPMPVFTLTKDLDGSIWAASNGGGARKFIGHGYREVDVSRAAGGGLTTPLVRDVSVGVNGSVWFATPVGLFQFQQGRWSTDIVNRLGADPRLNYVNDLLVANDGEIWIASEGAGVRRKISDIDGYREWIYDAQNSGLPDNGVLALAEDRDGAIWAGTYKGVARFLYETWSVPVAAETLPSPIVTALLATPARVWIGTEQGLAYFDLDAEALTWADETQGYSVEALALDSEERLWVGTRENGILIRDEAGAWIHMHADAEGALALPGAGVQIGGLAHDPALPRGMWAIVSETGLAHFDGETWTPVPGAANKLTNLLYRLFTDPVDGSLWVGREGGVSHYDRVTWGAFSTQDGLQSSAIYAIAYEPDGKYWFGGAEGLTRYAPDRDRPWVRIGKPENMTVDAEQGLVVQKGVPAIMNIERGDLQTSTEELRLFFRTEGNVEWEELKTSYLPVRFDELGTRSIDIIVRDQAFNYSDVLTQLITVVPRTEFVYLPVLGAVERSIFWTLLFLATTAMLGFGYVSFEIFQTHLRAIDALNRGFNPYVSGEPVRQGDMFFGRRELLQKIIDTLHNNSIMIHGERRIGKTSLLYQLANTLRDVEDPDYRFLPIYVDLEGTPEDDFFHYLMEEIAVGVLAAKGLGPQMEATVASLRFHDLAAPGYGDREFAQDLRQLVTTLQAVIAATHPEQRLRLILLIDEVDVLSKYNQLIQQQLRRIFMRDFAATMGAVVAGIQISKEWDRVESPWFNMFNEIALQPFDRDQALELLIEPVRNIYVFEPGALEFIIEKSNGRPYRLQQYALRAVNYMLERRHRRILREDAEAAHFDIESDDSSPSVTDSAPSGGHLPKQRMTWSKTL